MNNDLITLTSNLKSKLKQASTAFNEAVDAVDDFQTKAKDFAPVGALKDTLNKLSVLINADMATPAGAAVSPLTPGVKKKQRRSSKDAQLAEAVVQMRLKTRKTFVEIGKAFGCSSWLARHFCVEARKKGIDAPLSRSGFSAEEERDIMNMLTSDCTYAAVGRKYGVSPTLIKRVATRYINKADVLSTPAITGVVHGRS